MRRLFFVLLLTTITMMSWAQDRKIQGTLVDKDSREAMMMATVQLLKTDSTYAAGALTDENGHFTLQAPKNGKYIVKVSNVGYTTSYKNVEIAKSQNVDLGKWNISQDAVMLKEVVAQAQALKVTVVEDTFVYNSAAYRTPEGSAVEELVKLLPGATVDDNGTITINGKQVKKIKMDGKEFMNGDTQTALKNLPTAIVDRVKAYEDKSDRARITGIDDGEDEMTLDFSIKAGMNKGVLGNADLAYGSHDRYAERIMGMLFQDDLRMGMFSNFNNTNDMGFGGRGGGFGRGRSGLNTNNMLGINVNYEKTGLIKIDGSVRWNHGTNNAWNKSSSESFVINNQSFSNSLSQSFSKNKSWNGQMRLEWTPDTMTNIMVRPSFSWSDNDSRSGSMSASFDSDPYDVTNVTDPLEELGSLSAITRNSRTGSSLGYGSTKRANLWFQFNRKLNSKGRNISFNGSGNYGESANKNFSTTNMTFPKNPDTGYSTNRYNETPSKNWSYNAQISYSEPIADRTYLQFSYRFSRSYSKSDRVTYDFSTNGDFASMLDLDYVNLYAGLGFDNIPLYRNWDGYLMDNYTDFEDTNLSKFTEYNTYVHDIEVQFRRVRENYNFNFGVLAQPQTTKLNQHYLGSIDEATQKVFNVTPTADFRYYFSRQHQLRFNYRGRTQQPSVDNLIEIADNSDPMNVRYGNKNLKPAFTNSFNLNYNNFLQNHFQTISANASFNTTRNSTTRVTYYNPETAGTISKPENISGNWSMNADLRYNVAIDTMGVWNLSIEPSYRFNNSVGLATLSNNFATSLDDMTKYSTKVHNIGGRLALSFRNSWLNIEPDGNYSYQASKNELRADSKLNTYNFSYGTNLNITLPWGMTLASDIHMRSRRGHSDANLNTNELIWNAQIAQTFLRGRNLTMTLQFYDILKNQSNFSRSIDANSRRDTENNAINSYAMLHVIYRFTLMPGGKDMMNKFEQGRPDFSRPEFRRQGGYPQGGGFQGPPPGMGGGFGGPR